MNCPVCNRENTYELSICISCGAMNIDSIREELTTKPAPIIRNKIKFEMKENLSFKNQTKEILAAESFEIKPKEPAPIVLKTTTAELESKETNPTLIEFHSENATLPEWRLKLQNAVRKRQNIHSKEITPASPKIVSQPRNLPTNGNAALKIETLEQPEMQIEAVAGDNSVLANALKRINQSRQQFLVDEQTEVAAEVENQPSKVFNFPESASTNAPAPKMAMPNQPLIYEKPKLASSLRTNFKNYDTSELPPLPEQAQIATSFEKRPVKHIELDTSLDEDIPSIIEAETVAVAETKTEIKTPTKVGFIDDEIFESDETEIEETEEIDDCAPFAMRFNAGLFDFIIGIFTTFLLLAPFMIWGENWFSFSGFITFAVICSIVMFVYLTTAIGFFGRSFGMKLFALEVVDIEGEKYPTFHQSAVSTAIYLLSLPFAGAGFITLLLNDEKRAVHDLVSGTIVVKEY